MAAVAEASASGSEAIEEVRELLDRLLRVTLSDNRVLVGRFSCFDKQRNVLLSDTWEQRFAEGETVPSPPRAPDFERNIGLVLAPSLHIVSVYAMEEDEHS